MISLEIYSFSTANNNVVNRVSLIAVYAMEYNPIIYLPSGYKIISTSLLKLFYKQIICIVSFCCEIITIRIFVTQIL